MILRAAADVAEDLGLSVGIKFLRRGFLGIIQAGPAAVGVEEVDVIAVVVIFAADIALTAVAIAVVAFAGAELFAAAGALHVGGFIICGVALAHAATAAEAVCLSGVGGLAVAQSAALAGGVVAFEERIVCGQYAAGGTA